jgi:replicative DNA helicase
MSQVSNEAARGDPRIIGFKGAGEIAAAADLGLWLERDRDNESLLQCYIRKNRHGPTGKASLKYTDNFTRLEEL